MEWEVDRVDRWLIMKRGKAYYDREERSFLIKDVQVYFKKCSCAGG